MAWTAPPAGAAGGPRKGAIAASSGSLDEPASHLPPELVDRHRAIVSIMEELEAIDLCDQRVAAQGDPELAAILAPSRDEEQDHPAMTLEWLGRHEPALDARLRIHLLTTAPILEVEAAAVRGDGPPGDGPRTRGGDPRLDLGADDVSLGHDRHDADADADQLYLEESCTFTRTDPSTLTGPQAVVALPARGRPVAGHDAR